MTSFIGAFKGVNIIVAQALVWPSVQDAVVPLQSS
jgi:hypothetical protein